MIRNMKISTRILLGLVVILALMIGVTIVGILEVRKVTTALHQINAVNSVKQRYAINFRGSVHDRAIAIRDVYLIKNPRELSTTLNDIQKLTRDYDASAKLMDALYNESKNIDKNELKILKEIRRIEKYTNPLIDQIIQLQQTGNSDKAYDMLMSQARPAFVEWLYTINQYIDLQEEKNRAEAKVAEETANDFTGLMILTTALAVLLGAFFAVWIIYSIRPLKSLTSAMQRLAKNDLSATVPTFNTENEIGQIARTILVFKENALAVKRLEEDNRQQEIDAKEAQRQARKDMARTFDQQFGSTIRELVSASTELQNVSNNMKNISQKVQSASHSVSHSTQITSDNITTVASATNEMTTSAGEITAQVSSVASKAQTATASAEASSDKVNLLNTYASNIGEVVTAIRDIADQTNLLALNATIESARAGEAGKGFAVVADEVKKLASETSHKTEEISSRINEIQIATQESVTAMSHIISNINEINEASTETASAANQQNSVINAIITNIGAVSRAAEDTNNIIGQIETVSSEVSSVSEILNISASSIETYSRNLQKSVQDLLEELNKDAA